ncbi:hypothetical protein IAR55_005783 [Kwoniella newhampshirensis]|uniref:Homeobox domain-containing protein n=1 Tax=Kwoniella newhampshirensis TaxID=1651941 RepID=A0AAW0YYG9_9TREE
MDSKHEHMSSPRGPEDASNIADEYPSPERIPTTLSEHEQSLPTSSEHEHRHDHVREDGQQHQQHHHHHAEAHEHHHRHEDTDMQTELANQVAAQAIEAAVAAEVQANADAQAQAQAMAEQRHQALPPPPTSSHGQTESNQHLPRSTPQHHPRQPTFPRPRSSLPYSTTAATSSSSPLANRLHTHTQPHTIAPLTPNEQISVLREAYARNPNPGKKELEQLAEKTGRPWNKIREYFRQRRNKLRGLEDLEGMEEPGRASGWLQVSYRAAPPNAHVSQLSIYNSYRNRFDPYAIQTPLMGGQDLIQLACATFPGCEMARDEGEYVLKGLKEKEKEVEGGPEAEEWERGVEGLVEPLRAGSWLLSSFQHQTDPSAPSSLTQTDLYTSYAARFSSLLSTPDNHPANGIDTDEAAEQAASLKAFEDAGLGGTSGEGNEHLSTREPSQDHDQDTQMEEGHQSLATLSLLPEGNLDPSSSTSPPPPQQSKKEPNRLLNPLELINLTRMTFPKCEPIVDSSGRFVIRGLERREGLEPGKKGREGEMFPFALMSEEKPGQAFVGLMKRKLAALAPEPSPDIPLAATTGHEKEENEERSGKRHKGEKEMEELAEEDKELLDGLKRFRGSKLGEKVREVCVTQ